MSIRLLAFALVAVSACLIAVWLGLRFRRTHDGGGVRHETVHVVIDDDFVARSTIAHSLIEPLWSRVDIYESWERYRETLRPFTVSQRHLFAIEWYRSEVNNGGHDQFFCNSTGIVTEDAIAGLRAIGLDEGATILESASERIGGVSRIRSIREAQLDGAEADFTDLDDRFFALEETGAFDEKMLAFARAHPSDFHFEGSVERMVFPGIEDLVQSE